MTIPILKEVVWNYAIPIVPAYHLLPTVSKFIISLDPFSVLPGPSTLNEEEILVLTLKYGLAYVSCYIGVKLARRLAIGGLLRYNWIARPKSIFTKIWAVTLKSCLYSKPRFYEYQNLLPRIPLPSVKHTVGLLKLVTGPTILENSGEKRLEEFNDACDQMLRVSRKPQALLMFKRLFTKSWLADLWIDYAYLSSRGSLMPSSNYFCADTFHNFTKKQAVRASSVIYWTMRYYDELENERLEAIVLNGLIPTDCHIFKNFSATRVPGKEKDELVCSIKSRHVVVFRKGRVFIIHPYKNGKLANPNSIKNCVQKILDLDVDSEKDYGIAALTALGRTEWYNIRKKIPKEIISKIESARFTLSLDTENPKSEHEDLHLGCFGGNSGNMWYDKSININVHSEGRCTYNMEHACGEATIFGLYQLWYCAREEYDSEGECLEFPGQNVCEMEELDVEKVNIELKDEILKGLNYILEKKASMTCGIWPTPYGKDWIKKQRISPDGFMQVVLQLVYYKLNKTIPKMYESGSLALYYLGRTETIRSVSQKSIDFCKNPSLESLKQACQHIVDYKKEVVLGQAADRHLFGLYVVGRYLGIKYDLFENFEEVWKMDNLSTSSTPLAFKVSIAKCPIGGGFGPQLPDAFGVSYFYSYDHTMGVAISAFKDSKTDAYGFSKVVWDTMIEVRQMMEPGYVCKYGQDDLMPAFGDRMDGKSAKFDF